MERTTRLMAMQPMTKALMLFEELRKVDKEMPAQQSLAFFIVAGREGIHQAELIDLLDVSKSAANRIFLKLADHDLITMRPAAEDPRRLAAHLTARGRSIVNSVSLILNS